MTPDQPSRSDGRHSEIDDAARQIALAAGLAAITLRRLASTAGVAPGVIAEHEPSIGALVARTFQELVQEELLETTAHVAEISDPLEALRMLVDMLVDDSHEGYNSVWADAWSLGRRNPPLARAARENMVEWNDLIKGVIARGVETKAFGGSDPDLVAMQFLALIDSTTAYALVDYRTHEERVHLMRRTLEISLGLPEGTLAP
ncbi:TetR family transcriptional regulator C-terminal domain-containing protein [Frondihabitans cladoniiphilus]|uniref:BetI-type transcriptional repressor C-terminal domain-containing protein n=1 Tax=Frondihabitans cladoniiphilus TaxID=715785 RepID=A0ABP8W486_9MICO